jgi:hypothetical protein
MKFSINFMKRRGYFIEFSINFIEICINFMKSSGSVVSKFAKNGVFDYSTPQSPHLLFP